MCGMKVQEQLKQISTPIHLYHLKEKVKVSMLLFMYADFSKFI